MFNAKKSQNIPKSLSKNKKYDSEDVVDQLFIDFNSKCYLCGDKVNKDHRIEHFTPHRNENENIKYDWNNLFLSCDYCNGIKSDSYNFDGKDIINSVNEKVEDYISHYFEEFPILEPILELKIINKNNQNTIELLNKIYFGINTSSSSQVKKREHLIKNIKDEIGKFIINIYDLINIDKNKINETKYFKSLVLDHFENDSAFLEFKKEYLRKYSNVKIKLEKILDQKIDL